MAREPITYLLWSDLVGVTRTRGVPTADLAGKEETGLGWACAGQALTAFDSIVDNPWGPMDEVRQIPDPAAAFSFEGEVTGESWNAAICYSKRSVTEDWDCCTRTFYARALDALKAETGLTLAASFEHEFTLEAETPVERGFTFAAARRANLFLQDCGAALRAAGVVPESLEPEYGASQYEISCAPSLGVAAADAALIAREIIRAVAAEHGARVSFTPKPARRAVGNGAHIHFSLVDAAGANVTHDPGGTLGLSPVMARFCAGILAHLDALVAISAPTPVSYYRLTPHAWSCGFRAIGLQNREAALRVTPSASPHQAKRHRAYNVEYRPADACASPYLTLGALVLAGLDGIRRELPLPPAIDRDPADLTVEEREALGIVTLPTSLEAALAALEADEIARGWFSPTMYGVYRDLKLWECASARELDEAALFARYKSAY
ncbi:glutamine synthetase [Angulomicrobium tetraedrale]|uniref:Glutamine synthetase n=1 Tax=Ancylobacter tetraedralis TaxID=217068 RepID=A0A839Z890_9HYPH|nr:glutamine synthetase family protein [Ancylobacter tetraedralis]MBB3771411.1 glutamine synthetase [Ancylobacter tetraedralis]